MPDEEKMPEAAKVDLPQGEAVELLEQEASASLWQENRRLVVLALCCTGFLLLAHFTPLSAWLADWQRWKRHVDEFGPAAHGMFGLLCALAVMAGVPRLPLCAVAGTIFGFMEGLMVSWLGTALGSYGAFLLARWGARRVAAERLQRWPWLRKLLAAPTLGRVIWVRQLMVPGVVLNFLFGISAARHRVFIAGTLIGYLPLNIALTLVGSGLGKAKLIHSLPQILAALAVAYGVAWLVLRLVRQHLAAKAAK